MKFPSCFLAKESPFFIIKHGQMLLYRSCSQKMCRMTRHYSSPTIKLGLTRLESTKTAFFQKVLLSFLLKTFNFTSFVWILMPPIRAREWRSIRKLVKAEFSLFFFFYSFCWKSVEAEEELSLGREEEGVEDDDDYGQLWCPFFCYHQTVKTTMEMEKAPPVIWKNCQVGMNFPFGGVDLLSTIPKNFSFLSSFWRYILFGFLIEI